jgi:UvrD-like helicase C-terminal domain
VGVAPRRRVRPSTAGPFEDKIPFPFPTQPCIPKRWSLALASLISWCLPRDNIHNGQGSDYTAVVIPLTTRHYPMLQQNLVYTRLTRGKRSVVLVGQRKALAIVVKGARTRKRWSKLREWLIGCDPP